MISFYPRYFFEYLKDFFTLLFPLILFFFIDRVPKTLKTHILSSTVKGFIYGVYAVLAYFSITSYSRPMVFFGFSYGIYGIGSFFYFTAVCLLFTYLCEQYSPIKALLAAFFTLYLCSVLWEIPTFGLLLQKDVLSPWFWSQIIVVSLIIPALYVFKVKPRRLLFLIPFFFCSIFLTFVTGDLSLIPQHCLTPAESLFMLNRLVTLIGLFLTFWS